MNQEQKGNYHIIADHLRTTIFALADGALLEPKGRGYILKKLVKRTTLLAYLLGLNNQQLEQICELLIKINSFYYPHLEEKKFLIIDSIRKEIIKSRRLIEDASNKLDSYYSPQITVKDIFFWYDTHGIPLELIKDYLKKKRYSFPITEFNELLVEQRAKSSQDRKSKKITTF